MLHGTRAVLSLFTVLPLLSDFFSSHYTQSTFLPPQLQDALTAAFTLSFQKISPLIFWQLTGIIHSVRSLQCLPLPPVISLPSYCSTHFLWGPSACLLSGFKIFSVIDTSFECPCVWNILALIFREVEMKSRSNVYLALVKVQPHMLCLASLKKPDEFILRDYFCDDVCDGCLSQQCPVLIVQGLRINTEKAVKKTKQSCRAVDQISLQM